MPRDDDSGIGRQQQEELRQLSELHQAGKITDEQYRKKRDRIAAKAAALKATSRGADGLVSTKAIKVEKSMNPLLVKGGIAVVILAVVAQVGYLGIRALINYRPTLKETPAPVAVAPPPVVAPPVEVKVEPEPEPEPEAVEVVDVRPVVEEDAVSRRPASHPRRAVVEMAAATGPMATPGGAMPPEPVPSFMGPPPTGSAALPPGAVLTWDVRYPDQVLSQDHPFREWCQIIKRVPMGNSSGATIGVAVGPEASGFDDPAYMSFRDNLREKFRVRIGRLEPQLDFNVLPQPVRTGRGMAERMTGISPQSKNIAVLATTVQDGRCFAYFFAGPTAVLSQFNDNAVNLAKVVLPIPAGDAPSLP